MTTRFLWIAGLRGPMPTRCDDESIMTVRKYQRILAEHKIGAPQSRMLHSPKECHERLEALKGESIPRGTHEVVIHNPTPTIRAIVAKCDDL